VGEVIGLAARLKAHREERGISQSQAARELEVARTAYRLWEMEAARPAPDRWRLVARWLGVSMSTLLLSEGLMSEAEADGRNVADARYQAATGEAADIAAALETGGFFEHGQAFLDRAVAKGIFTEDEAAQFGAMLERIARDID